MCLVVDKEKSQYLLDEEWDVRKCYKMVMVNRESRFIRADGAVTVVTPFQAAHVSPQGLQARGDAIAHLNSKANNWRITEGGIHVFQSLCWADLAITNLIGFGTKVIEVWCQKDDFIAAGVMGDLMFTKVQIARDTAIDFVRKNGITDPEWLKIMPRITEYGCTLEFSNHKHQSMPELTCH